MANAYTCILSTVCVFLSYGYETAFACPRQGTGQSLLGEYSTHLPPKEPLVLALKQYDIDIKIIRKVNNQETTSFGPSGRNGIEFIYIRPGSGERTITLCILTKYNHASPGSYQITRLNNISPQALHGIELMDKAAQAWSENNEMARRRATAYFDQVSRLAITELALSEHARLYSLNARIQAYRYREALSLAEQILTTTSAAGYSGYSGYWGKGQVLLRQGKHQEAISVLSSAIILARSLPPDSVSTKDIADITNSLAEAYLLDGNLARGRQLLTDALFLAGKDHRLLAAIYNNLGFVSLLTSHRQSGSSRDQAISQSIDEHQKARQYAVKSGDMLELTYIDNNLATLYQRAGRLRKARQYYWQALNLIDPGDTPLRFQVIYSNLGLIYQHLGDYQKSESFLKKALEIASQTRSSQLRLARLQCRLGNTQRLMGKPKTALVHHNLCIRYALNESNRELLLQARYELTADYLMLNNTREARKNADLIIDKLSPETDRDSGLYSQVLKQYARLERLEGRLGHARIKINLALQYSLSSRNPGLHSAILAEAMHIHRARGDTARALAYGQEALTEVERLHQYLEAERLGPAWSKTSHEIYLNVAEILLNRYRETGSRQALEQTLEVLERSRGTTLRHSFSRRESTGQLTPKEHLQALSELADTYAVQPDKRGARSLPFSYYQKHEQIESSRLNKAGPPSSLNAIKPAQIQEKLQQGQTVLYYLKLSRALYVFTITQSNTALHYLGDPKTLDTLHRQARKQLITSDSIPYQTLNLLSELLLLPAAIPGDTQDLILVLHRNLHSLPFAALPVLAALPAYQPLSARFNLRVVPSMTSYFMARKNTGKEGHTLDLAIFADPVLSPPGDSISPSTANTRELQTWSRNLPPLPWTAREAEKLKTLFRQAKYQIYTGPAANRSNLRTRQVRHARILHIASHGYFHSLNPDNIGFALAAHEKPGGVESGFITLTELFSFRFNNELVVISGCDTGMGKNMDGEGMLGLSRGFIAQGAKHVISTLWPVADKASAKFMQLFYQHLKQLGEVDRALSKAQDDMRSLPAYRHPFYWATYVLNTVSPEQTITFDNLKGIEAISTPRPDNGDNL
ncbi:CHAT domain-containing protein [Thalassomonas viridans]|uniref:CHAT domain-containing protein n=1 Tax=Thalassomonas viridans TaxID=137584 RepID=A0AAE9Z3C8_9GAMM|nr:CHAT domain-containing protein [Thalassomonas viridans]WDE05289.1 CHAT domain-containing protein [Thalassomonas viridans]